MLISNPLSHELFEPTVIRLVFFLAVALLILLFIERHHLSEFGKNTLFRRWRTWVIIAIVYVGGVLGGALFTMLLIAGLTFQGLREYCNLVGLPQKYRQLLLIMGLVPAPIAVISREAFFLLAPLFMIIATLQPLLFKGIAETIRQLAFAVLGWAYIAWLLGHVVLIHSFIEGGDGILLALAVAIAFSDVGAYTVGKLIGRHQLSSRLSPNKTIEGTLGNFIGAFAGVFLMRYAFPADTGFLMLSFISVLIAVGSIWGDLLESAIKREFGEKDAGHWLPGFGGILDRIDSFIISIPIIYYLLWIFNQ